MKIAVACEGNTVTQHFGHCEGFQVYETESDKIVAQNFLPSPGHRPGFLPVFLHEQGVNVVVSGGMGGGAVDIFNEKGVEVVLGASGDSTKAVEDYLQGKLVSSGSICRDHNHHHHH